MGNKKKYLSGFTLVEIIVSALILSISFAVVLYAFTYARGYIRHAQRRIVAANLVRGVSNYLYKELSLDGVNSLSLNTSPENNPHNFPFADDFVKSFEIDGVRFYEGEYSVTGDALGYYRVTYNVTYPL